MSLEGFGRRGLDLMFYSGAARALSPICRGMGAILQLNNVRPGGAARGCFNPNGGLVITPGFLEAAIAHLRARGFDIVSFEDAIFRLQHGNRNGPPFVVFTVDGGHRDGLVHAWPVFRKHDCPFTIFLSTAVADGTGQLWWRGLEAAIAGETHMPLEWLGAAGQMPTVTDAQKQSAWRRIYWHIRNMEPRRQHNLVRQLCSERGIDLEAMCRAEAMSWHEIRTVSRDPLCTIGAQSVHYFSLARLTMENAEAEIVKSSRRIEAELGERPKYFSYPYGDASAAGPREFALAEKAGFAAAVTARKGMMFPEHRHHLLGLPRLPLDGLCQEVRYLDVLLSGVPTVLSDGFRWLHSSAAGPKGQVRSIQRTSSITNGTQANPAAAK